MRDMGALPPALGKPPPHPPDGAGGQLFQGTQIWCGFPSHYPGAPAPRAAL